MTRVFRVWFTFDIPVDRGTYFAHGVTLAVVKYAGDVGLVYAATGRLWTPADYLASVWSLLTTRLVGAPPWLLPALALWTLPFIWIGVTLTMRRSTNAGLSPWLTPLFFVPYLNYLLMAVLCLLPTTIDETVERTLIRQDRRMSTTASAISAGIAFGIGMIALAVLLFRQYSASLFLLTPFGSGMVTALILNHRREAGFGETAAVTVVTFVAAAAVVFLLAVEGLACILMALPLCIVVGLMGALFGYFLGTRGRRDIPQTLLALLVVPASAAVEPADATGRVQREVRSAITIDAPPSRVWRHVIAFSPIPEPTELPFRLGIAYPTHARIDGQGRGAVRYCVFSTGAFVEPITGWEPDRRLSFDVVASPAPLRELSIYRNVTPPHLDDYLRSRRGEFRLIQLTDGRTRLEGSTWYELHMAPEIYWRLFSDALIRRIHMRVLAHMKREAEK